MKLLSLVVASLAVAGASFGPSATAQQLQGQVFTISNSAASNYVVGFNRDSGGHLTLSGYWPTFGFGTGTDLGSQGAIILSDYDTPSGDIRWMFTVNPGSNEVVSYNVIFGDIVFRDLVPSGGQMPVSVAMHEDLLYVLNAGGSGNLVGFRFTGSGQLSLIPGSTRPLSGPATQPAQVSFGPGGRLLFVTEKATNQIITYVVGIDGTLSNLRTYPSAGMTPFGFAFGKHDTLIVSEAAGGATNASSVSSYKIAGLQSLPVIAASVPTTETAACWMAVTPSGRYAYTTNTGSGTVSGYLVGANGSLDLLDGNGVTANLGADSHPIDEAVSRDGRFLYVLARDAGRIDGMRIRADGSLVRVTTGRGFPRTAAGLAAH